MRPSGRPLVTSRCLRSPVDAGSIPYSAVSQPRPLPAIQRGTDSCTDAVQITRVSPHEISAEPVAVRTKPGSIVSAAARPARAAAAALAALTARPGERRPAAGADDVLDLAERQLQEARAERAERLGVAGAEERVAALARPAGAEPAAAEHVLDLARQRARRSVTISTPRPRKRWSIGRTSG